MVSYTRNERKVIISELQKLADSVLNLKKTRRQKRPIIIEFSGSPKSGKTSCINSLGVFLKRNDFKVEIIQERASVCPVSDKRSPMFNIWTACASVSELIAVLEREEVNCDVLLLDRGIFDAFCWFKWLLSKGVMEDDQKKAIESFLLIDSFVNKIDIVFAFCATPEVSIEREYANLLTEKPGSIMNEEVLSEYLCSVKETIKEKKQYFHKIFEIDTSSKNQDEVGKEVTDITLNCLQDMLMERIGYFKLTNDMRCKLLSSRILNLKDFENEFADMHFDLRDKVEGSNDFIQPIPIAVITDLKRKNILSIKKSPKAVLEDSPEKDKILLYVGGHPRYEDSTDSQSKNFLTICRYTLRREVKEEIGVHLAFGEIEPFLIYTPDSDKSKKHLAICFLIQRDIESLKLRLDPQELIQNKGVSKSGRFQEVKSLSKFKGDLEPWSIEILKHCFDVNIGGVEQISLLGNPAI